MAKCTVQCWQLTATYRNTLAITQVDFNEFCFMMFEDSCCDWDMGNQRTRCVPPPCCLGHAHYMLLTMPGALAVAVLAAGHG